MVKNGCMTPAQVEVMNTLRMLWMEHVLWTRQFIQSTFAGSGDLDAVTARLLQNPAGFAAALMPFYGTDIADRFEALMRDHLLIAAQLVNAAKAGDTAAYDAQRTKWYENADDIADLMAQINPHWDNIDWQTMLYDHLYLTELEAMQIGSNQYEESIRQFDEIQQQALEMGDEMADGLFEQFPDRFK